MIRIDQDVEAVQLEAVPPVGHKHLAGRVDGELDRDDGLDDDVFDVLHQLGDVDVVGFQVAQQG